MLHLLPCDLDQDPREIEESLARSVALLAGEVRATSVKDAVCCCAGAFLHGPHHAATGHIVGG